MIEPTVFTWVLSIIGIIIYTPTMYLEYLAAFKPDSQKTKDLLVGKGQDYPDKTYAAFCKGHGWADLIIFFFVLAGCVGVLLGHRWGYIFWFAGAGVTLYAHTLLLFLEGKHIFNDWGPLAFFTYGWALWVYWAVIVLFYSFDRLH